MNYQDQYYDNPVAMMIVQEVSERLLTNIEPRLPAH